jgi:membrane-associated phospholipid phosphatase
VGVRRDPSMKKFDKFILTLLAIMIIIATQTLKQHYIIDVIAGLIITEGFFWIILKSKLHIKVGKIFTKLNYKFGILKKVEKEQKKS